MKKIYLLILPLLFSLYANAQCTPDPNWNSFGISPGKLPDGEVGTGYATIISFVAPKDTSIVYNGTTVNATIDSATVEKISGYPQGFIWKCNNTSCTWKGGQKGCALLEGNAVASHLNKYQIKVYVRTYFRIVGLSNLFDRIDSSVIDFKIIGGINSVNETNSQPSFNVFPNPVKNILQVEANNVSSTSTQVAIYNLLGQTILNKVIKGNLNSIDVSELPKGIYIISFNNNSNLLSQKLIIE